jgi:hypothetical protein
VLGQASLLQRLADSQNAQLMGITAAGLGTGVAIAASSSPGQPAAATASASPSASPGPGYSWYRSMISSYYRLDSPGPPPPPRNTEPPTG